MFQLKALIPTLLGTRGGGGVRMGPSSSAPDAAPALPAPAPAVRRTRRSALSAEMPVFVNESTRVRVRAARVTESAAITESCLLVNDLISLPFASMNSSTTSRAGRLSQ